MICPLCGHKENLPGADWCSWCLFDLMAVDRPTPADRVERSLMMDPVAILKLREPVIVPDDSRLDGAVQAMLEQHVGAVLVTDARVRLIGILTERDFLSKVAGRNDFGILPVSLFMTRDPETVRPGDSLGVVLGKMAGGGYRHLPVVEENQPVGVVSVRDLLRHIVGLCQESH